MIYGAEMRSEWDDLWSENAYVAGGREWNVYKAGRLQEWDDLLSGQGKWSGEAKRARRLDKNAGMLNERTAKEAGPLMER